MDLHSHIAHQRKTGLALVVWLIASYKNTFTQVRHLCYKLFLSEFITSGPEQYTRYVLDIAPSLQALRANAGAHNIFIHRLIFAVRYAEFHQRLLNLDLQDAAWDLVTIFQEEIAPKSWWGVLLCDAVQLLQYGKFS